MIDKSHDLSVRRQGKQLQINRSDLYLSNRGQKNNIGLMKRISELYADYQVYSYKGIRAMLEKDKSTIE